MDDPDIMRPWLTDYREQCTGSTPLALRPDNTDAVSRCVQLCHEAGVGVVPQGGNTGYMCGATPSQDNSQILLRLDRMNRIHEVDAGNHTMTVDAGCILAEVQNAAADVGLLFPLSLGAEGSCQIGGNLATNAGGTHVLRYGNMRELTLGLEVVLADGRVWKGLRALRKDNSGYDLKQLFIGSEGTLGIITAAVLQLYPQPAEFYNALIEVRDPAAALSLLGQLRKASLDAVNRFEYIDGQCLNMLKRHIPGIPLALQPNDEQTPTHYVLVELASGRKGELTALAESVLAATFETGEVIDAAIADTDKKAAELWRMRDSIPESQRRDGCCIKHDISVPVSKIPDFLEKAEPIVRRHFAQARLVPFGHMGDGNLHYNLVIDRDQANDPHIAALTAAIHDLTHQMGGSISAEHGIGVCKRDELKKYKSPAQIQLMQRIKQELDPAGVMNPGKLLPPLEQPE